MSVIVGAIILRFYCPSKTGVFLVSEPPPYLVLPTPAEIKELFIIVGKVLVSIGIPGGEVKPLGNLLHKS